MLLNSSTDVVELVRRGVTGNSQMARRTTPYLLEIIQP
jgi:hypothetical protein